MKEGLVIVPQSDNDGNSLETVLHSTMKQVIGAFGGCSVVPAQGAWTDDNGELYIEPVNHVITAYEPSKENDAKLRRIALDICINGKQLAAYVRYADGNVEIVKVEDAAIAA